MVTQAAMASETPGTSALPFSASGTSENPAAAHQRAQRRPARRRRVPGQLGDGAGRGDVEARLGRVGAEPQRGPGQGGEVAPVVLGESMSA